MSNESNSTGTGNMSSSSAKPSNTEGVTGSPPASLQEKATDAPKKPAGYGGIPSSSNNAAMMMDPMAAAIRQQEEQQLLIAAAMAKASNNLMMAGSQYPTSQEAILYQQALMAGGRGGGLYPGVAYYGAGPDPTGLVGFPPQPDMLLPQPPPPAARASTSKPTRSTAKAKRSPKKSSSGESEKESDLKSSAKDGPYFDASTVPDEGGADSDEEQNPTPQGEEDLSEEQKIKAEKERQNEPFPRKLFRMIEDAKNNGREDIVSFFSHGRAWIIHKPKEFLEEIIPKYMSTTRMASFHRQLNLYGFKRITSGIDKGGYYHEFFLQGRKGLLKKIKRKRPTTPKVTRGDLDQAARISNAILSSGKFAHLIPTYGNTTMGVTPMMHPQMIGIQPPQGEAYANARMGALNSLARMSSLSSSSHLNGVNPSGNELSSDAIVPGTERGVPQGAAPSSNGEYPNGYTASAAPPM